MLKRNWDIAGSILDSVSEGQAMTQKVTIGMIVFALCLTSCGQKVDEAAEALKNMNSISESADEMQKTQNVYEKRRADRKAKGDTLALASAELKKFLPSEIDGYTAAEAESQSMDMEGMSWSIVSKEFTKDDGTRIKVTITDYNASESMWGAATMMFAIKWSVDNADESSMTIQTNNTMINGHERFGKKDKNATLTYGLGGRFLLQIEGSKQTSTDFVKAVASRIDMQKMAGM